MAKYKFNDEQLRFVEERKGFYAKLRRVIKYFIASILLSVLYYFIASLFLSTDYEKELERQTQLMQQESDRIEKKLEILDGAVKNLQYRDKEIYKSIFNSEPPIGYSIDKGFYRNFEVVDTTNLSSLSKEYGAIVSDLEKQVSATESVISGLLDSLQAKKSELSFIPAIVPVRDFTLRQTGASIGKKINPFYKTLADHTGIDIVASSGTEVIAAADGKVSQVIRKTKYGRSEGNVVEVDHGNGYITKYMMLGKIKVRKYQKVKRGDIIGEVGISGMSFAPHLHYEVWYNDKVMEPINYFFADLSATLYVEMLMRAANTGQSLD